MVFSSHSEAGHNHGNEDSLAVQTHFNDAGTLICVLADGQGGRAGGGAASQLAVSKCLELAQKYSPRQLLDGSNWCKIVSGADEAVSEEAEAGYATLIALCVSGDKICGASCGDSAAYLVGSKNVEILTERQHKNPPVGTGAAYPAPFSARLKGDSQLLVMSDGVWKFLGYDTIVEQSRVKRGHELIYTLRQLQWEQYKGAMPDDFSIIVV